MKRFLLKAGDVQEIANGIDDFSSAGGEFVLAVVAVRYQDAVNAHFFAYMVVVDGVADHEDFGFLYVQVFYEFFAQFYFSYSEMVIKAADICEIFRNIEMFNGFVEHALSVCRKDGLCEAGIKDFLECFKDAIVQGAFEAAAVVFIYKFVGDLLVGDLFEVNAYLGIVIPDGEIKFLAVILELDRGLAVIFEHSV